MIPTYDRAALVPRAIESALSQTLVPAEVVVVDDGSRDETMRAVEGIDPRVRYLRQENAGCSAARNRGVRDSRAPWIAFLDSDDRWDRCHLERIACAIAATGGRAGFYFADTERGQGHLWSLADFSIADPYEFAEDGSDWVMRARQPMMLQSSVFRRDALEGIGGLWEALRTREDTHVFFRLGLGAPVCAVSGIGARMGEDAGGRLTTEHPASSEVYLEATIRLYRDVLRRRPPSRSEHRRELARRLAEAYWQIASLGLRTRQIGRCSTHSIAALRTAPGLLPRKTARLARKLLRPFGFGV